MTAIANAAVYKRLESDMQFSVGVGMLVEGGFHLFGFTPRKERVITLILMSLLRKSCDQSANLVLKTLDALARDVLSCIVWGALAGGYVGACSDTSHPIYSAVVMSLHGGLEGALLSLTRQLLR